MSLGGPDYDSATESAIANAVSNEVIVFAAAGNDGWSPVEYPAAYADCIAVGATNPHNPGAQPTRADFSDYGSALDLMAPGVQITQETFDPNYGTVDYYTYDGTSCSSPHAAAVAAMLIAKGGANVAAVRDAMQKTARGTNHKWTQTLGWGEIDAFAAVQAYGGAPNQPPQAVAKASPTHGAAPLTVQFDGSASSDPDGSIVSYVWTVTQTGEVIGTSAKFSHTFTKAGTNTVSLAVKDNDGATASDSVTISVSSGGDDDAGPGDDDSSASDDDLGDDACGHMLEKIYNSCDFVIMQNGSAFYSAQTAYDMCRADQPNGDVWACMEGCETHPQVHTCSDYQACVAAKCSVTLAQNPSGDDDSGHDSVGYGCSM